MDMDIGDIIKYLILFFAGTFAAGTIVYVVAYCFVRGGIAGFLKSIAEQHKPKQPTTKRGE